MIEPISKINFLAKPKIEPVEPVKQPGPLDNNSGLSMTSPLKSDVFQTTAVPPVAPVTPRAGYTAAVDDADKIGQNTSNAVIAAQKGDSAAQRQLDVVV